MKKSKEFIAMKKAEVIRLGRHQSAPYYSRLLGLPSILDECQTPSLVLSK